MSAIPIKLSDQGKGANCVVKIEPGTFAGTFLFCSLYSVWGPYYCQVFLADLLRELYKAGSHRERSQLGSQERMLIAESVKKGNGPCRNIWPLTGLGLELLMYHQ